MTATFAADCPALAAYISHQSNLTLTEASATMVFRLMLVDGQSCQLRHGYIPQYHRGLQEEGVSSSPVVNIAMVVVCLISAAMASGLTQGLLSLDLMETKIIARSGNFVPL